MIDESDDSALDEHRRLLQSEPLAWHYYTDGSLANQSVGIGVVRYDHQASRYESCGLHVGPDTLYGIYEAELLAIYKALLLIQHRIQVDGAPPPADVYIHSDSQAALYALASYNASGSAQYILARCYEKAMELENAYPETTIQLRWVPGHKGVDGNEKADKAANEGRTNKDHRLEVGFDLRRSLAVTRRQVRSDITAPMRIEANRLRGMTSRAVKISTGNLTSAKTAKLLASLPRATRCLATQLRSGHFPTTKSYRYRFRLIDSPKCSTCRLDDTISHRVFICRKHFMARITLKKKIAALGIRFELGPMLRNASSLQALYEFLRPQLPHTLSIHASDRTSSSG